MEHLNLLFEADPLDPLKPAKQWNDEFQLCKQYDMFTPVLFNLDNFLDGQDIWCSQRAKKRDSPSILRCHALTDERYTKIYKALLKFDVYPVFWTHYYLKLKPNNWMSYGKLPVASNLFLPEFSWCYSTRCNHLWLWKNLRNSYTLFLDHKNISLFSLPKNVSIIELS